MTLIFNFAGYRLLVMLVCHCKGVSDREIDRAIRAGAATPYDLARSCGAGSVCGGCRPLLDELLESRAESRSATGFEFAAAS